MDSVKAVVFSCLPQPSPPDVSDFLSRGEDPPRIAPDIAGSSGCAAGEDPPAAGSVVHTTAVDGGPSAAPDVAGYDVRSDQDQDGTSDGGQDQLSSLPDQLRSSIVARLPLRDALRTREISKRWLSVWPSTELFLDDSDLTGFRLDHRIRTITRVLHMHPGPFCSVRLLLTCFEQAKPVLRVWTRILANKGVKDLCLVNQPHPIDMDLPLEVLSCATLRRLWLAFFRFPCTSGHCEAYPSLTELGLCATTIEASDLEHMLRSSPALEMLALVASYDKPMHICVHGHSSLRCMVLWMSIADEIDVDNTCLLERLILWKTRSSGGLLTVKIARTPNLRILGYLEPMLHKLQIGDTIIEAGTKVSPSTIIPSLQVLALKWCFHDKEQTKLLPCFLRCFPNISALHIESAESEKPTSKLNRSYWQRQDGSIECLSRHVKKVYFHGFTGHRSEIAFLRFVVAEAMELELLLITLSTSVNDTTKINKKLVALGKSYWTSTDPKMFVNQYESGFTFHRASNCLVVDPFFSMENLGVPSNDS